MGLVCVYCRKSERKGVSYHKFPASLELRRKWFEKMGVKENFELKSNSRLCSDHFAESCFTKETNERERIHSNSVPSKFDRFCQQCICCSNVKKMKCNVYFYKFPLKNINLLNLWIKNTGLKDFHPDEKTLICDAHFEKHCFYKKNTGRLILKSTAYPTLFFKKALKDFTSRYKAVKMNAASTSMELHSENESRGQLGNERSCILQNQKNPNGFIPDSTIREAVQMDVENISMKLHSENEIIRIDKRSRVLQDEQNPESFKDLQSPLIPEIQKTSENTTTLQRENAVNHDHCYHSTPREIKRRYDRMRQELHRTKTESKIQKQVIKRLRKKVSFLNNLVRELQQSPPAHERVCKSQR